MTRPRSTLVSLSDTPWYHCVSRCVRRAYLCGEDFSTGQNFDHRRGWIASRIKELAGIFAIDVAAYAVMSNHYHVVVRVDQRRTKEWSTEEVLARWTRLFTGPVLVNRYLSPARTNMCEAEVDAVEALAMGYRVRLHDLSWFMRTLNEWIARQANAEDGCKGRFWEGRFKSQALLDEKALLTAMAYVDLNPVRAGLAETPEDSEYTSIRERVGAVSAGGDALSATPAPNEPSANEKGSLPPAPLMPFDGTGQTEWAVPFAFEDYVELVDWTGRAIHPAKRGFIAADQPKILGRIGIDGETFIALSHRFLKEFGSAVGAPATLVELSARRQTRYLRGIRTARRLFERREARLPA